MSRLRQGAAGMALLLTAAAPVRGQSTATLSSSRQHRDETSLDVSVGFGVGTFRLRRDQGGALYRTNIVYDEELFRATQRYDVDRRALEVGLASRNGGGNLRRLGDLDHISDLGQRMELAISPRVPVTLDLELGVVEAEVDLGGLSLVEATIETGASEGGIVFSRPTLRPCRRLGIQVAAAEFIAEGLGNSNCERIEFQGGAGDLTMDFTGEWQHQGVTAADVRLGFGALTLRFPSQLGVSITLSRFLASFDPSGFEKRGDVYYSSNYESAAAKLDLRVQAALGDVDVVWVP